MIRAILFIAIIVLVLANLGGQALATQNFKRENAEIMRRMDEDWVRYQRDLAKKTDTYYSYYTKSRNDWFYGDGSLRIDPQTLKTYPKGQYRATSNGIDCNMKQAGPDVKRAPRY